MDKNPNSLAFYQKVIDSFLAFSLSKQVAARLRNMVYDRQQHSSTMGFRFFMSDFSKTNV